MSELQKLVDEKYTCFRLYGVKTGMKNGEWMEVSVKVEGTDIEIFKTWINKSGKVKVKFSGTGGKRSYVKVYIDEILKLKDITSEAIGDMIRLVPYIQWGTGLLIHKRKKSLVIKNDFEYMLSVSRMTAYRRVKELVKYKLLMEVEEGYKVNSLFIRKGVKK